MVSSILCAWRFPLTVNERYAYPMDVRALSVCGVNEIEQILKVLRLRQRYIALMHSSMCLF
jgi:hypothetical protein